MESNRESSTALEVSSAENGLAVAGANDSGGRVNSPETGHSENAVASDVNQGPLRQGTTSSARFNILCTMVGGGCLSLPMAFQKTGNGLLGPILLILTACITEFCFRLIVKTIRRLSPVQESTTVIGNDSFESMAGAAFGMKGFLVAKWLVTAMCFFGAVGYAVLLRDMLQPIADAFTPQRHDQNSTSAWVMAEGEDEGGPSLASNLTMLTVILIITPVCTLKNLSSLEKLGAASMSAILILGGVIVFRSLQCNLGHPDESFDGHVWKPFKLLPDSAKDVLDSFPLFVSTFVCHYNIPAVHNEFAKPSPKRVNYWLRSTTLAATIFYMTVGLAGSAYGHCTPTGKVQGNVLLDFDEDDPLLLVARMCLACTITLAFPLLVIPARDILLRTWFAPPTTTSTDTAGEITMQQVAANTSDFDAAVASNEAMLREPLLTDNDVASEEGDTTTQASTGEPTNQHSFSLRLGAAILVLWSAAAVASCVKSIDIVWDLLGSSLSILLSYLIPCASFIAIVGDSTSSQTDDNANEDGRNMEGGNGSGHKVAILIAKGMILVYVPLMIISTANAFIDTFFH